jgi:hypothetical protein
MHIMNEKQLMNSILENAVSHARGREVELPGGSRHQLVPTSSHHPPTWYCNAYNKLSATGHDAGQDLPTSQQLAKTIGTNLTHGVSSTTYVDPFVNIFLKMALRALFHVTLIDVVFSQLGAPRGQLVARVWGVHCFNKYEKPKRE